MIIVVVEDCAGVGVVSIDARAFERSGASSWANASSVSAGAHDPVHVRKNLKASTWEAWWRNCVACERRRT